MATALELTYLETRNRLKEKIRKEMRKEIDPTLSGYNDASKEKILFDKTSTYGSFFGPSLPTIAERVIQESNNLPLESGKVSAFRVVSCNSNDSGSLTNKASSKKGENCAKKLCEVTVDLWMKVQRLRETRDYSFLFSDDTDVAQQPISAAKVPVPLVNKDSVSNNMKELQKPVDSRLMPKKVPVHSVKKDSVSNNTKGSKKHQGAALLKSQAKRSAHNQINRKGLQEFNDGKLKPKQPVTVASTLSKKRPRDEQMNRKKSQQLSDDDDEAEKALRMIRKMFNTQRFVGRDDSDANMEASFADILKEEKRSERLARKEDQEQLRLLEEEERRERTSKLTKGGNQGTKNYK